MKKNSSILIIYNARLVDSKMDGNGTIIIAEGKIRGITLGECKSAKNALLLAQAFLTEVSLSQLQSFTMQKA